MTDRLRVRLASALCRLACRLTGDDFVIVTYDPMYMLRETKSTPSYDHVRELRDVASPYIIFGTAPGEAEGRATGEAARG